MENVLTPLELAASIHSNDMIKSGLANKSLTNEVVYSVLDVRYDESAHLSFYTSSACVESVLFLLSVTAW